ncbi:fimbria/pilus periplasmic chaperone [Vibrio comitans]|uniref:Pili assembly chaperone N-terminal domain-containing protein n=1 Tax=Vibrio comitans NBRC 102076 TaxID=1219078 RepID=A0A4Y3IN83_9VIBR|nr:fimbria/pilus periplasmic chaperone [Vibrio comitans]GEA60846.1 hypothetical protein VCO01S_20390 [Vibrio comitans NBRC 102076]
MNGIRWLVFILTMLLSSMCMAYQVNPMFQLMEVVGSQSQSSYQISNDSPTAVLLEIRAYKVEFDADSQEALTPADEDFLILPPQMRIEAGGNQRFRIRYLGSNQINQTAVYRVIFEQIKTTEIETETSQVKFMFNFSTIAFVSPTECEPILKSSLKDDTLEVMNTGNCVLDLNKARFELSNAYSKTHLKWPQFQAVDTSEYLLPGRPKLVKIPEKYQEFDSVESTLNK